MNLSRSGLQMQRIQKFVMKAVAIVLTCAFFAGSAAYGNDDSGTIFVVHGDNPIHNQALTYLEDEWEYAQMPSTIQLESVLLQDKKSLQQLVSQGEKSAIVVIIGNEAASEYIRLQNQQQKKRHQFPPAVLFHSLYVDELVEKTKNSTAIRYEIPLVTSLVRLRLLHEKPLRNIGVIYRSWNSDYIDRNALLAEEEGFVIHRFEINDKKKSVSQIKRGISAMDRHSVEAYWIVGDNVLLNNKTLTRAWIPRLKRRKASIITSFDNLTATGLNFANFSVLPETRDLATQVTEKVIEIIENNWTLPGTGIEEPLSMRTHLNMQVSRKKGIPIKETAINYVDKITK